MGTRSRLVVLLAAVAAGCSTAKTDATTPIPPAPAHASCLPPAPSGPAPDGSENLVLALRSIDFGDATADGWKSLGCDLDGLVSDATSTDVCRPAAGANADAVKTDGDDGIDNSFGANVVPILRGLEPDFASTNDALFAGGKQSILLVIEKLGAGPTYAGVRAALYQGGDLTATTGGEPPRWDGTDVWPIAAESVANGDPNEPNVVFPNSYVADGTWASGSTGSLMLRLIVGGYLVVIPVEHAWLSLSLAGDGKAPMSGAISGVVRVETLWDANFWIGPHKLGEKCPNSPTDALSWQIRQAADILADGTQDPTRTCDAISIGLAFTAAPVELGGVVPASPPPPDGCVTDAGGGG